MTRDHASLRQRAQSLSQSGQAGAAIQAYSALLRAFPADAESWYNLAHLLRRTGNYPSALGAYDQALRHGISSQEEVHLNRSVLFLEGLRDAQACEAELNAALAIKPDYTAALFNLGGLQEDLGKREEARATYERLLALEPRNAEYLARRAGVEPAGNPSETIISELRAALQRSDLSPADRSQLGFALGRLLDGCCDWTAAFEAYRDANEQAQKAAPKFRYSKAQDIARRDDTKAAFPTAFDRSAHHPVGKSEPVFILGMFRSGSTLVEQVLSGHPDVVSGGELDLLMHLSRALGGKAEKIAAASEAQIASARDQYQGIIDKIGQGRRIVTDKRPENFWDIGLIKRLFPRAKIIHTQRNPLDNCLSVYFQNLHPSLSYAMDLESCAEHLLIERQMMAHWEALWPDDILTVKYAEMVSEPNKTIAGVLSFLGLPWDDACLRFYEADSIVRTASVWQVRQPLHAQSLGRWKNYEAFLTPLRDRLATLIVAEEL